METASINTEKDGWMKIQSSCCPSFTPPCLCVTQEARPQHLWMLISCLSDYSQHHGRKCRQCEPAWGPCPGSVYGWPGCYSHNNYPPPLSRTETDGSLRLMHSCAETGEAEKNVIKVPKDKQDTHSERVYYLNGNSNLCTLDKRTNRMSFCLRGFPLRLADVKLDVQQKTNSQERPKQELCECLSAYGQELARWHKPQTGFLIRYMGHPYAASAKSM